MQISSVGMKSQSESMYKIQSFAKAYYIHINVFFWSSITRYFFASALRIARFQFHVNAMSMQFVAQIQQWCVLNSRMS